MTKKWKFQATLVFKSRSLWQVKVGPLDFTTAQKMKFSVKDFFSKCNQIRRKPWIWSPLLKKSLMENFIFYGVFLSCNDLVCAYLKFCDQDLFTHLWLTIELICTRSRVKYKNLAEIKCRSNSKEQEWKILSLPQYFTFFIKLCFFLWNVRLLHFSQDISLFSDSDIIVWIYWYILYFYNTVLRAKSLAL